jgi:hypothetical protein
MVLLPFLRAGPAAVLFRLYFSIYDFIFLSGMIPMPETGKP